MVPAGVDVMLATSCFWACGLTPSRTSQALAGGGLFWEDRQTPDPVVFHGVGVGQDVCEGE